MTTTNVPELTGDRCRCSVCGLCFNSTEDFDRHRIGKPGTPERRCKTADELASRGWGTNGEGFLMRRPTRARMSADAVNQLRQRRQLDRAA